MVAKQRLETPAARTTLEQIGGSPSTGKPGKCHINSTIPVM
jgi:hypothetical protein